MQAPTLTSPADTGRTLEDSQIVALVQRLRRSFNTGITRSEDWRRRQLERVGALLAENKAEILEALKVDMAKPELEAWGSDVRFIDEAVVSSLKSLSSWMAPRKKPTRMATKPNSAWLHPEPLGVVLIIAPWNYPLQLALDPLVGAIAAGNCAIVKPSEVAVATSALIGKLVPKYLDPECIAVVEGGIPETTTLLDQRFDHIFYTGNSAVGRIVMAAAAKNLTPVTLELGGKNPCLVDSDVDLETVARRIVWGKFFNAGQTCAASDYVLVTSAMEAPLLGRMATCVREFYGDDPKKSPDFPRIINERHLRRLEKLLASGDKVIGGEVDLAQRYLAPTILRNVDPGSPVMSEEIFGPILPVLTVPDFEAAIDFVNARPKPLAMYVFSRNEQKVHDAVQRTSSGGVCINDTMFHILTDSLPFGGVGESGMGAYHGEASFDTFTHFKSVMDRPTYFDSKLRYPPYSDHKLKWIKRLA